MPSYTNLVVGSTAVAAVAAVAAGGGLIELRTAPQQVNEYRINVRPAMTQDIVLRETIRELADQDFSVITAADLAMLSSMLGSGTDDLDYSAFFEDV